jgi:hypothetical protein
MDKFRRRRTQKENVDLLAAEKVPRVVIPSELRNLSLI